MTRLLAFDTVTDVVSIAVGRDGEVLDEVRLDAGRLHAEHLVPAIHDILHRSGTPIDALDAVAVGLGPGRFTGLRVGVTTAKALAFALGCPVVGVGSLELVAYPQRGAAPEVVVVLDARRREVFWARFRPTGDGSGLERLGSDAVGPPADVVGALAAVPVARLLVGDGLARYAEVFADVPDARQAPPADAPPSAAALVELATAALARGEGLAPDALAPRYLRESDAVINLERGARP